MLENVRTLRDWNVGGGSSYASAFMQPFFSHKKFVQRHFTQYTMFMPPKPCTAQNITLYLSLLLIFMLHFSVLNINLFFFFNWSRICICFPIPFPSFIHLVIHSKFYLTVIKICNNMFIASSTRNWTCSKIYVKVSKNGLNLLIWNFGVMLKNKVEMNLHYNTTKTFKTPEYMWIKTGFSTSNPVME